MSDPAADDPAAATVRALLAPGGGSLGPSDWPSHPEDAVALGWALKDACYAAWTRAPAQARRAADGLCALARAKPHFPLPALAHWTCGIASLGEGAVEEALGLLRRASEAFAARGHAASAAQARVPQVMALSMLGRQDEALRCAREALAEFLAVGDERSAGKIELNVATLLYRQDRHAEAAVHYRRASERFVRVGDDELAVMAEVGLGHVLVWQNDEAEAERVIARAHDRARNQGLVVLQALALGALGQLALNEGNAARALPALARAVQLLEQAGAVVQQQAEAELTLAEAYFAIQLLPEAEGLCDRLVVRCDTAGLATEQARALQLRAQVRAAAGDATGAAADLEGASRRFLDQDNEASAASCQLQFARLQLGLGQVPAALADATAAEQRLALAGMGSWRCEARLLIAQAHAADGQADLARGDFEALLGDPAAAVTVRQQARIGLAGLDAMAGRADRARGVLHEVLEEVDLHQAALPGDDFRVGLGAARRDAGQALVALARAAIGVAADDVRRVVALWRAMEAARSPALALAVREGPADRLDTPRLRTLRMAWRFQREQASAAVRDADPSLAQRCAARASELERELLEVVRRERLARTAHAGPGSSAGLAAFDPQALQARLGRDQAWVQFHLVDHPTRPRWLAVVARHDRLHWVEGGAEGLVERLQSLRFQMDTQQGGRERLKAHATQLAERTRRHLQALHRQIWQPIEPWVEGCERLVVVPDGVLHRLPFCALHDGQAWLVQRHDIRLASGARSATVLPAAPRTLRVLLALGVTDAGLPQVQAELTASARPFGAAAQVWTGLDATAARLREGAARADVVHLACHAHFRADNPGRSSLVLADGELTADEVATLPLQRAPLVTLSACETGLGAWACGDDLLGLVRGFLRAGASSVVSTLWTVDDAATAGLMAAFYPAVAAGASPDAALRAAQSARAARGDHPFEWAAFALHGGL